MPRTTVAQLEAKLDATDAKLDAILAQLSGSTEKPKASRRSKKAAFPAVGSTFTYTSKAGNSVEHTIEAIRGRGKRRRAFTDQGNKFPVSLLSNERLQAEGVVTPA